MKHLLTLAAFASLSITTRAITHIVTCQNGANHFLPVTINAMIGDTIHWTWVSGNHIVGIINETDIPALADTWYAVVDATYNDYEYVVAYPGNYHYVCHPAQPHGEDGYIVVAVNTAVQEAKPNEGVVLYPNPFTGQITLEADGANGVTIHNLLGEKVASYAFTGDRTALRTDLGNLPKGFYFFRILRNGVVLETRRTVKQ